MFINIGNSLNEKYYSSIYSYLEEKPASSRLAIRPECTDPVLGNTFYPGGGGHLNNFKNVWSCETVIWDEGNRLSLSMFFLLILRSKGWDTSPS